jgi:nucleotide sugar dehydrogenase
MNMKRSIAVIGQGFVGGSLTTVFSERGFDVYTYDKAGKTALGGTSLSTVYCNLAAVRAVDRSDKEESIRLLVKTLESSSSDLKFSKVYFVCLPTPMFEDGSADLSIVEGALEELASVPGERIAVVKSTVPPGSTEKWNEAFGLRGLHVVFNPEFLTEANALDDMRNQNRIILGGPRPWINEVKQVFQTAFPKVPLIKTSSTTAEMVKYTTNNFLTVKVAFANEMAQICEALDKSGLNVDYDKVVEYAKYDRRLGESHWAVPGPDGHRGYGGSCFCKDINAIISVASELGVDAKVMKAAWEKNLEVRPERDWEGLIGRAISTKKAKQ